MTEANIQLDHQVALAVFAGNDRFDYRKEPYNS